MIIGFMRNFRNPSYMSKLTAMLCKSQGIDLIYIRPFDVNIEKNKVKGKMFIDNTWINVETDIPPFIDISPYCFKEKNRKTIKYLRNKAFLSDNGNNRISKEKLQEKLQERSEEHTSELQSRGQLVCRLPLEYKNILIDQCMQQRSH